MLFEHVILFRRYIDNLLFIWAGGKDSFEDGSKDGPYPGNHVREPKFETWLHNLGMFKCGSTRCITCKAVQVSSAFTCSVTQEIYQIRSYINCNTRNSKNRIREHLNNIKSGSENTPVLRHFKGCNSGDVKWVSVQGIQKVSLGPRGGNLQSKLLKE
ncbi:hypothetical protein XELAEV_18046954mg [Xenopus laevis]|uniref:Uncharacterized protein n=1 Tax=Xenopus laevis TaxID=8355 RepID=A0A974BUT1_XENLA|nr:hypothetical protein XELAEV_18046954mg [Xenopus laevis]